jgi:hypothetical protein
MNFIEFPFALISASVEWATFCSFLPRYSVTVWHDQLLNSDVTVVFMAEFDSSYHCFHWFMRWKGNLTRAYLLTYMNVMWWYCIIIPFAIVSLDDSFLPAGSKKCSLFDHPFLINYSSDRTGHELCHNRSRLVKNGTDVWKGIICSPICDMSWPYTLLLFNKVQSWNWTESGYISNLRH